MTEPRPCKESVPGTSHAKRPAPHPGPRCTTCHRAFKKATKARAHEKRVCDVYGLKPGEYEKLYVYQGRKCFICRRATGASKRLAVDHNHETGEVRGLLCKSCNHDLLGKYNVEALYRAIHYLRYPPARNALR